MKEIKFRIHKWLDLETMKEKFGIQCKISKEKWAHCVENGKALLFEDEKSCKEKLEQLRNKHKMSVVV